MSRYVISFLLGTALLVLLVSAVLLVLAVQTPPISADSQTITAAFQRLTDEPELMVTMWAVVTQALAP